MFRIMIHIGPTKGIYEYLIADMRTCSIVYMLIRLADRLYTLYVFMRLHVISSVRTHPSNV